MKKLKTITINGNTFEIDDSDAPGKVTEEGGAILTDCDSKHRAGEGAIAAGLRKDRSGAPDEPAESDWRYNEAIGEASMAVGMGAVAYSRASKSFGYRTQTGYPPNEAEAEKRPEAVKQTDENGNVTYPKDNVGQAAFATGSDTAAVGNNSFAAGYKTQALTNTAFAAGNDSVARGSYSSFAAGHCVDASGPRSTAFGWKTEATGNAQMVFGKYNAVDPSYACIVGNGNAADGPSNAYTLEWDGTARYAGDVHARGKMLAPKEYVYTLCPFFTESGAVVACEPMEGSPLEIISKIEPVQEGSGAASPTNVRPILPFRRVKLHYPQGKNIYDKDTYPLTEGKYINSGGSVDIAAAFACTEGFIPVPHLQGQTITLNHNPNNSAVGIAFYNLRKSRIAFTSKSTILVPSNAVYMRFTIRKNEITAEEIQIEVGETSTAYEPYSGTVIFDLGQDVYGGSLDWASGVLTIDRKLYTFDGKENYTATNCKGSTKKRYKLVWDTYGARVLDKMKFSSDKVLCSKLPTANSGDTYKMVEGIEVGVSARGIWFYCEQYATDVEDFKQMMKGAQLVYELAEPIVVQLTPKEVIALSGLNSLYSDSGDITVTGRTSPLPIINTLMERLSAIEAAVLNNV